jgi:hypothetical protein
MPIAISLIGQTGLVAGNAARRGAPRKQQKLNRRGRGADDDDGAMNGQSEFRSTPAFRDSNRRRSCRHDRPDEPDDQAISTRRSGRKSNVQRGQPRPRLCDQAYDEHVVGDVPVLAQRVGHLQEHDGHDRQADEFEHAGDRIVE